MTDEQNPDPSQAGDVDMTDGGPVGLRVEPVEIEDELQRSYLDYAMSVIVGRALPSSRDGLKPVHRRILFSMYEGGMRSGSQHRKSAAAVGDVMKKYHPHGDSAIYDALVRMAQEWAIRYPLIEGHGNFGSMDGDAAAAMRYCVAGSTRVRMAAGSQERIGAIGEMLAPDSDAEVALKVEGHRGIPAAVDRIFHSGSHPTLRLRTKEGYELVGTTNHPLLCITAPAGVPMLLWKLMEEIVPGDRVVLRRGTDPRDDFVDEETWQLGLLLGAFMSEGFISEKRAGFNSTDKDFFDDLIAAYDRLVGGRRYIYERSTVTGRSLYELDIHNLTHLRNSPLASSLGQASAEKRIPDEIWNGTPGLQRVFLQALFTGDGSSSLLPRKTIQISCSTRSPQLAQDVQDLLLTFGVVSRQMHCASSEIKVVITNRRDARHFSSRVGFLGDKQSKLLSELAEIPQTSRALSGDHVPFLADYIRDEGGRTPSDKQWLRRHNVDRIERWERDGDEIARRIGSNEVMRVIEPLIDSGNYFAEVASVEDGGVQPVFSLRVQTDDHAFITNGFVSHNTEARLSPLAMELLRDIDEDTVDFIDNYDGQESEPVVLPSRFPNLLVNGSSGIAVGMATNVPPHNLREITKAIVAQIENPEITLDELMGIVPGPDFPTGAHIMGIAGIREAYQTGRGSIRMRAVSHVEEVAGGEQIVVTEVPYQVNKANLAVKIAELVNGKRIAGIRDIQDESNRAGIRFVIQLKRDANAQVVLNQLYKMTQLQDTFGVNNLSLVDGVPRVLPLKATIQAYVDHQVEMVTRRTRYRLRRAEDRAHILEGLIVALDHLDEVIALIRGSASADAALSELQSRFGLSELQARAILDMQLRRLAALERQRILDEFAELQDIIADLRDILARPERVRSIVVEELTEITERFGDERRTRILPGEGDLDMADLITEEEVVVTLTEAGYLKRTKVTEYRTQRRGGKGVVGTGLRDDDIVRDLFVTTTHHWLLFFTNQGRVYRIRAWQIPEKSRTAKGTYIASVEGLALESDERVAAVVYMRDFEENADSYLLFGTRQGMVKRTQLSEYDSPRSVLIAINLRDGDELIGVHVTTGEDEVFLVSRRGMAIRFHESDARPMGRGTTGVIGMNLSEGDKVLSMTRAVADGQLLVVTDEGYGKRTPLERYPLQRRGGKGVKTAQLTDERGGLVGALVAAYEQEIFIVTDTGTIIRMDVKDIRPTGRATQGVRVMKPSDGAKVASIAPVMGEELNDE